MPSPDEKFSTAPGRTEPLPGISGLLRGESQEGGQKTASEPRKFRTGRERIEIGDRPLSRTQKITLSKLAKLAFETQSKHGLIDDGISLETWRRKERAEAIGTSDIAGTKQRHWRRLRGHFKALSGDTSPEVLADLAADDDDADRQGWTHLICREAARLAQLVEIGSPEAAESYILSICSDKRDGADPATLDQVLETWPPHKLEALLYTVRNRISAIRGVGSRRNRNKSQIHSQTASIPEDSANPLSNHPDPRQP